VSHPRTDLAGLLSGWYRLRLADQPALAPDGDERLVGRIVEVAAGQGRRCAVAYGAAARLGLSAQRGEQDDLEVWRRVTDAILDSLHGAPPAQLVSNPPLRNARRGRPQAKVGACQRSATRMKPA
jgi:hypothetical protein